MEHIDGQTAAADIKTRLQALGITMDELCYRARVSRSTPVRWARGSKPQAAKYARIMKALKRLERKVNGDG